MGYPAYVKYSPKRLANATDTSRRHLNIQVSEFYGFSTKALNKTRSRLLKELDNPATSPADCAKLANAIVSILEFSARICQIPMNAVSKKFLYPVESNARVLSDQEVIKHAQEVLASEGLEFKPGTAGANGVAGTAGTDAAGEVAGTAGGADQAEPERSGAAEPGPGPGPGGLPMAPAGPIQRAVLAHAKKKTTPGGS